MKFGYNPEGKLVPIEELELRARLAEIEAKLDNREPTDRAEDIPRLRAVLTAGGKALTVEDENVLSLYRDGIFDFHNVEHHFGARLTQALGRPAGGGDDAV